MKAHFSSCVERDSQAFVNSKREIAGLDVGCGNGLGVWIGGTCRGVVGGADVFFWDVVGWGLCDLNIVCDPEERNIPPPTLDDRDSLAS
jgi:hypothetical protein